MRLKIDLRSALCGLGLGILAVLAIGAAESGNSVGRYQVSVGTSYAVIVDTETGQAWGANIVSVSGIHAGFFDKKVNK